MREAESSATIFLHIVGFGAAIVGEIYHQEENRRRECITRNENFAAITNPGVIETFFHVPKMNWKKCSRPAGADGQLSVG